MMKTTNNSSLRVRAKHYFLIYKTSDTICLNVIKDYFYSTIFSNLTENQIRYYILSVNCKHQPNTPQYHRSKV